MRKKYVVILLILICLVSLIGILYFIFKHDYNLDDALNYMKNLESYTVTLTTEEINPEYDKTTKILENVIENGNEKIIDGWGETKYFYNNKPVKSNNVLTGEKIWYYEGESTISTGDGLDSYKEVYNELFAILSKYKFSQKKNVFEFVNETYIDENGNKREKISDFEAEFEKINYFFDPYSDIFEDDDLGEIKIKYTLDNVSIYLNKNKISSITLSYTEKSYLSEASGLVYRSSDKFSEKLIIDFSDHGTAKVDFPESFFSDLEKTTAGDWVGKYESVLTCSDGKMYDEVINLTGDVSINQTRVDSNVFWVLDYKSDYKNYNCEKDDYCCERTKYFTEVHRYIKNDNKIILYDFFEEDVLGELELSGGKLIEKDEKGNIITVFEKVSK